MAQWLTIPAWRGLEPVNLFRREQGPPVKASEAPRNVHALARGTVELPPGPCEVRVCAADRYRLYLDGAYAGQGPVPAYPERLCFDAYRVGGGRTLTLGLHFYYQGLVNRVWNSGGGRFGFWVCVLQNAAEVPISDWRCIRLRAYSGAVVGYDTQYLEDFDSRLWPEGWEMPGYPCTGWETPVPAAGFPGELAPRPIRPLWEGEIQPRLRPVPGGVLLDFGSELAGNLAPVAEGPSGAVVTLRFGEELDGEGRVRFDTRCGCRYEERWTLGEGTSVYHPFDYKGFRYAELLHGPEVKLSRFAARARRYPMEESLCTLRCPDGELEDIFRICANAVRWCSQEGFLDCPSREKGQYLGDAVVTSRSQVLLSGDTALLRKCIRDFMASAEVSPSLMAVAPGSLMQEIADYSLLFPLLPLCDYEFTGDREFLAACYPAVRDLCAAFGQYVRADGLLEQVSALWNLVDWPENLRDGYDFPLTRPIVGAGCHNAVNALWYGANRTREEMERLLALPVREASAAIGEAFRKTFYRPGRRLFADSETSAHCSLHANLYAAFFGLLPKEAEDAFEALLLSPGRCCGVFPMYFALRALGRMGRNDALYRLLTRADGNGWRNMLREGATACFESWGRERKWNASLCHAWASGPVPLIIEELAGFRPDPSAREGFRFEPRLPGRLSEFELRLPWRGKTVKIVKGKDETICSIQN